MSWLSTGRNQRTIQIHGNKIYEYEDGRISQNLSYKTNSGSYWYSVNDIILHHEMTLTWLERVFPEIQSKDNNKPNLAIIALAVLGFVDINRTYQYGWKIMQINSYGKGEGQVVLRPVLLFESGAVLLERTDVLDRKKLENAFASAHLGNGMVFVGKILYSVTNTIAGLLPMALGSGGALIAVEKLIAQETIKRILKKIVTDTTKAFTKAAIATLNEIYAELERENLKITAGSDSSELKVIFLRSAVKGAEVFIVEVCLNAPLKKILKALYPIESELKRSIKQRFVAEIFTSLFASFVKSFIEVFGQLLVAALDKKEGIARLKTKMENLPQEIIKESVERLWNAVLSYHKAETSPGEGDDSEN